MKAVEKKYMVFALAGAAAAILQQPFFSGSLRLPEVFYVIAPGLIFALLITIAVVTVGYSDAFPPRSTKWYVLGALVLVVGMPIALAAGAVFLTVLDRFMPGSKFQISGIGIPFILGEIISCAVWSVALFAWTILTNKTMACQIMRLALPVTIAIMLSANLVEAISKALWDKSFLLPTLSIAEEVGSAAILAFGCAGHLGGRGRSVVPV